MSGANGASHAPPPAAAAAPHAHHHSQAQPAAGSTHLQVPRNGPRRTGSGLLPYTYSADSVSSLYGTTHYPLYQYPDDPCNTSSGAYPAGSPPSTAVATGGSASSHHGTGGGGGGGGLYAHGAAHKGGGSSYVFGASGAGATQIYASTASVTGRGGGGGGGSVDGRYTTAADWSAHTRSPRMVDSPVEGGAGALVPPPLLPSLAQDTHMNRLKQYNKLLSDLLGVAGGPMRSGISFYYTYGDATALLYNASIRAPCDEDILELLDQHHWFVQAQQQMQQSRDTHGGAGLPGHGLDGTSPGDATATTAAAGSAAGAASDAGPRSGGGRNGSRDGPLTPPPQATTTTTGMNGGGGGGGGGSLAGAGAAPVEDEGCSYIDYGDLAGLQETTDALETEQVEAQRARNMRFYSIFEHLHHAYRAAVLETPRTADGGGGGGGSPRSGGRGTTPVTAGPTAAGTSGFYAGLSGGVGNAYVFTAGAGASAAAAASGVTAATGAGAVSPMALHGVGFTAVAGSGVHHLGMPLGSRGAGGVHGRGGVTGAASAPRRLWGRVRAVVAWLGSLIGLVDARPHSDAAGSTSTTAPGEDGRGPSTDTPFDPAQLADYFPGERIVTFGDEWCIASRLDMHNGNFGLSPLQVWMAARYSRRFAGEVYLMDVIAAGSDPYYPAVRVLDEVVAHAVLYYHNHSLRDFVEDLEAELGLVYVPQTLWGRRALGLPDDEAEVQELDGLLYTAARRRQERRRRQRAQEKKHQLEEKAQRRARRHRRGHRGRSESATMRPRDVGSSTSPFGASATVPRRANGSILLPPALSATSLMPADEAAHSGNLDGTEPAAAAVTAQSGATNSGPPLPRASASTPSPRSHRRTSAATAAGAGANRRRSAAPTAVSPGSDAAEPPRVPATAATTPAAASPLLFPPAPLSTREGLPCPPPPPPPQPSQNARRHSSRRAELEDRLENEELAEYTWIHLQGKDQEEDEEVFYGATAAAAAGLMGGDINVAPHVYDPVMEREVYDERMLLRELDHLKEFLVENRNVLSSAMLTTAGSNSLEAVFGVPATVFPFLLCARESVPFVSSVFESLSYHYGALTYDNFSKYVYDVYHHDRRDVVRHTPRLFRQVNKSRRGCITYEELCGWMARKLSCGNNVQPNGHLLATSMSLRLPLALVAESRQAWDESRCVLKTLSDCDDDEY